MQAEDQKIMKENPNIRALKLLYSLCPSYFPVLVVKNFFGKLTPYYNLYLSAEIVNEIVGVGNRDRIMFLVLLTICGNFLITITGSILNHVFEHKETLLFQNEALYYHHKTLSLDYDDLENTEVRQLRRNIIEAERINEHGIKLLLLSVRRLVNITLSAVLSLVLGLEMLIRMFAAGFHWGLVVFVLLLIVFVLLYIWHTFRTEEKMGELSYQASQFMMDENRISDAVDSYNMGKDVRLYRQDKLIVKINMKMLSMHRAVFREVETMRYKTSIPSIMISTLLEAMLHTFVCLYALFGVFGVGNILKYVKFMDDITSCIICYFGVFADIRYNTPFVEDYLAYFDIPKKMYEGTLTVEKRDDNEYDVEFRDVSFRYPGTENYALRHVNIKFKIGEKLAVVGRNGSGKTTFIKLMCRLYDPTEGEILLNGVNIKKYDYDEYMRIFSVVFQDYKLFSFSLAENVAAGTEYQEQSVQEALKQAGFEKRLNTMSDGIQTALYQDFDENGVEISGGEAQKIALARALYKDAPFVILDEPTAALDPIAEYDIYTRFNEMVGDKTAIYISHRLSSCRFCDNIAVFENGRIVQRGSHEALVSDKNGAYYELWNAQAQYYIE